MNVIFNLLVYLIWFISTYYVVLFILILLLSKDSLYEKLPKLSRFPKVSFIMPAFNEESKIHLAIESLKALNYKNSEFIIVNDGSKDRTANRIKELIKGDKRFVFLNNSVNKGKAASLNQGISVAKGEFFACMDADSMVEKDILLKTLPYFEKPNVGAVTVSVEIRNPKGILQKMIDIEFVIGLSLFLKVLSKLDAIHVTPGPFSIYSKDALKKIGGFDITSMTEDMEIAYRLHKAGYRIENCLGAVVQTIVPKSFKAIYIQRRRWYTGSILTVLRHKEMIFRKKYGVFSFLMPYNYLIVISGMALFIFSTFLTIKNIIDLANYLSYTNFNLFEQFQRISFDILNTSGTNIVGMVSFGTTIALMIIGLLLSRKYFASKKIGILAFPFMFFLYQIFWIGSIISLIKGRQVKWR